MRLSLFMVVMAIALSACGWQLRGAQIGTQGALPGITVVSDDNYSPIARALRETWQKQSGNGANAPVEYVVQIKNETLDRRPVTYTSTGTPAQYEMTLQLTYAVQKVGADEPELPRTMATHRIFDFDPRNVVAKSEEERELLQHMRQQLAQRLLNEIGRRHNLDQDGRNAPQE